jgi:hypothetical protein
MQHSVAMQAGKIVEQGTHASLFVREDSVYHSLVKLQEQAMDKRANDAEEKEDIEDGDLIPPVNVSGKQLSSRKSLDSRYSIDGPELKVSKDDDVDKEELVRTKPSLGLSGCVLGFCMVVLWWQLTGSTAGARCSQGKGGTVCAHPRACLLHSPAGRSVLHMSCNAEPLAHAV